MRFEKLDVGDTVYWFQHVTVRSGTVVDKIPRSSFQEASVCIKTAHGFETFGDVGRLFETKREACLAAARKLMSDSADSTKAAAALLEQAGVADELVAVAAESTT